MKLCIDNSILVMICSFEFMYRIIKLPDIVLIGDTYNDVIFTMTDIFKSQFKKNNNTKKFVYINLLFPNMYCAWVER